MTSRERRWDELQTRWAKGEMLSAAEEHERLTYSEHDALARKELELFAELLAVCSRRSNQRRTSAS